MQSQNQWPFTVHRDVDLPALKETRSKYESRKQPHTGMMRALIVTARVFQSIILIVSYIINTPRGSELLQRGLSVDVMPH